jgi:CRP-like cAMP-binding protein
VDGTIIAKISARNFETLAASRPSLCLFIVESACRTISRLERHILVQGCTTSTKKVRGYLQSMARRLPREQPPVKLPLSRYDIADHVGIAVETVSRAMTELRRRGVIELEGPRCLSMRCSRELAEGLPGEP